MRVVSSPRGVVVFLEGSEISRFYEDEGAVFDNATERLTFAPAYVTVRNEDGDLLREIHVDSMPRPRMPSRKPDRPEWLKKVRSVFGYTDNPLNERGASMHCPTRRPYDENPADEEEHLDEKAKAMGAGYRRRSETLADYRARLSQHRDDNPRGRYVGVHGRHAFHATRGNHPSYAHPVHGPYASPARAGAIARRAHKKMESYKDNPEGVCGLGLGVSGAPPGHYENNPGRYEENCGAGRGGYDDNPKGKKGHSDLVDVERLATMFGIPTLDEAWPDWEAQKYGEEEALKNGASEEEAQEAGFAAERASQDDRYHQWHDALTSAVEHEFSEHGLTLVPRTGEGRDSRYPWEYRVVPTTSWTDAARKIMMTINGVGQFEFRNVREFLESGPWTAREAVLTHLHWMKDRAEVYGDKSALGRYERALR